MSERRITAVVLSTEAATAASLHATLEAASTQSRPPDEVLIVCPADVPAEVSAAAISWCERHPASDIFDTQPGSTAAVALGEVVTARSAHSPASGNAVPRPRGLEAPEASGRRAREIDRAERERQLALEAESMAKIPERLREHTHTGRRIDPESFGAGEKWLWIVPIGSAPGHHTLAELERTVSTSPRTAVVGPKRLAWDHTANAPEGAAPNADQAATLVDVGLSLTHAGHLASGIEPGDIDQGQADWREDVLAVALEGMLVRESTAVSLGGADPDLPGVWSAIDFCRRVWRSGERVAVQPAARVLATSRGERTPTQLRSHRTGYLLARTKHRGIGGFAFLLLIQPWITLIRALILLLTPLPRYAGAEIASWWDAVRSLPSVSARMRRYAHMERVPQRRLAPLYVPPVQNARQQLERSWARVFTDDERTRRERLTRWGIAGTSHGIDDATYGRHTVWAITLAAAASILTAIGLRSVFGRGELRGPQLISLPETIGAGWEVGWSTWVPTGLGARGPADPLTRLFGAVPSLDGSTLEFVLFASIPLAAMTAWAGAGTATRSVSARLLLAVVWALAPPHLAALSTGAWPLALVHVLLPIFVFTLANAIGLPNRIDRASVPAAAGAGVALLVIGAVIPVLVLAGAVMVALVAIWAPGRRRRLWWALAPAVALHAPYVPTYFSRPQLLLASGAVPVTSPAPSRSDLFMLWPHAPAVREQLQATLGNSVLGSAATTVVLLIPVLLVLPAAVLAPFLSGAAGIVGRFGVGTAALGAVLLMFARGSITGVHGTEPAAPPLGGFLSVIMLGLGIAAVCSIDAAARIHDRGNRRIVVTIPAVLAAGASAALVLGWIIALPQEMQLERSLEERVPIAAADSGRSEQRQRVLVLQADAEPLTASADLLVSGAHTLEQNANIVNMRRLELAQSDRDDPADEALRTVSADLLSRGSTADLATLHQLAISYVVVPGDPEEQAALIEALDASTVLEKVTQTSRSGLWRVVDAAPRVTITGAATGTALGYSSRDTESDLTSTVIGASGTVSAARQERLVVLSERSDAQWRASVDGEQLTPVTVGGWAQGFELPPGASGEIEIYRAQPFQWLWQVLLILTAAITALVAIPWRPRVRDKGQWYA